MLFPFVSRLIFLLTSTNQHGVHSPFVFNYITQCLYKKTAIKVKKPESVLLKSIPYFNVRNIYINPIDPVKDLIQEHRPEVIFSDPPYDLVFMDVVEWLEYNEQGRDVIHNDTIIIVYGMYQNRAKLNLWQALFKMPDYNVSIDLYYCGVLCLRKEQRKEHFKIRI